MGGLEELLGMIDSKGRRVYVAEKMIDLSELKGRNTVFILQLPDDSTAAGGRGGGLGERRVVKVYHYQYGDGICQKLNEIEEEGKLENLELPYHATALPVVLPDGKEKLVSGVIDPSFVSAYREALSS